MSAPGGMLIFALLLSLITSAFEDFLWQIRHGSIPVVEGRRASEVRGVKKASGMTGESATQAKVENWKHNSMISRKYIVWMQLMSHLQWKIY